MNFRNHLVKLYRKYPCSVVPNALWKTIRRINEGNTHVIENKEVATNLQFWTEDEYIIYWDRNEEFNPQIDFQDFRIVILHDKYKSQFDDLNFSKVEPYFKLQYEGTSLSETGFDILETRHVNMLKDMKQIVDILEASYPGWSFDEAKIRKWTTHPTYNPNLWFWVHHKETGEYVGLGIAEYFDEIKEGSLEWIQVDPQYQGQKIGKFIVHEMLNRLSYAEIITVAGKHNEKYVEDFYRSCGFTGDDIWWVGYN